MFKPFCFQPAQRLLLWLLLAVLPLQATAALIGAVQGQRHVHLAPAAGGGWLDAVRSWAAPQGPVLFAPTHAVFAATAAHVHDGTPHHHGLDEPGVLALDEPGDDSGGQAATIGLALLPAAWRWPPAQHLGFAAAQQAAWVSHAAVPLRRPPRAG